MDSVSGEESDGGSPVTDPGPFITPQASKQKGRQGADLVKDMYKMLDGSALVALGMHSLVETTSVTHRDSQESSCTSTLSDLFSGTAF